MIKTQTASKVQEISNLLNLSLRTTERKIKGLKDKGLISFDGALKTGAYVLTEEGERILQQYVKGKIKE